MYKIKNEHYFPDIFEYDIEEMVKGKKKIRRKAFIPIMIYDDLLECFLFNQMQLEKMMNEKNEPKEEDIEEQVEEIRELISFDTLIEKEIIIKCSSDDDEKSLINPNEIINKISFSDILKATINAWD